MATLTSYVFTQEVDYPSALQANIQASSISTALDHIGTNGTGSAMQVTVWFKDVLSTVDQTTLSTVMSAYGNTAPAAPSALVTTQFEVANKTVKLFSVSGEVGADGTVTILAPIPGVAGSGNGRYIKASEAFFDVPNLGDKILGVYFVDQDNISGAGAGAVVGSYTDDQAPAENQGWFIPPSRGFVRAETIGYYGFAPSGFYIKVVAKKGLDDNGTQITSGTLYVNFEWAEQNS